MLLKLLAVLLCIGVALASSQDHPVLQAGTCYYDAASGRYAFKPVEDQSGAAFGYFVDTIDRSEYAYLSIETNDKYEDAVQLGCAGYLEGILTHTRIWELFQNFIGTTFAGQSAVKSRVYNFASLSMEWTRNQVAINTVNPASPNYRYWNTVKLIMAQLDGMVLGYNDFAASGGGKPLRDIDLFILNMLGDLDDLIPAMQRLQDIQDKGRENVPDLRISVEDEMQAILNSHCSSIVKFNIRTRELFAAHEMWSSFMQLFNTYKFYQFKTKHFINNKISFSSYPGLLSSEDDFYILQSKLVVMETTNNVYNLTLYDLLTPESAMSWVRAMTSNYMATSGPEWHSIMQKYNSGTYNNQWMVVDYKLFDPASTSLRANTLWIGEQFPGYYRVADVTHVVNDQGYWPSYNIPYFEDGFYMSGYGAMVQQYGDTYTYNKCPRANIFRQRQPLATSLSGMKTLMRYNNWRYDPLSLGCAYWSLAARGDLAPLNGLPDGRCKAMAFGAINAKLTWPSAVNEFKAAVVAGPTHDTQPVFEWTPAVSTVFNSTLHVGQPARFDGAWKVLPHDIVPSLVKQNI